MIDADDASAADEVYACEGGDRSTRRDVLALVSVLGLNAIGGTALGPAVAEPTDDRPQPGDHLVAADAADPVALAAKDIAAGMVVIAWPMEPLSKLVRRGSRLNKVLLVRLDPAALAGATRERAADGVVAYSAVCSHAGCEVNGFLADQQVLECPCHNSHYNPRDAAAIIDGPTTRALAALPLKEVDGKLVVAKPFVGRVGIVQS